MCARPPPSTPSQSPGAPASDGGSPITRYKVTSSSSGESQSYGANELEARFTGLAVGTELTFTVVATNAIGDGPAATSNAVTTSARPAPPRNVEAIAGDRSVEVSWEAPANAEVTGYIVSTEPESTYKPGGPGHSFKPEVAPAADETIIAKQVNSAFIGTDLHRHLRDINAPALVILGVITNNSLEATVRNAGNLGHVVLVPEDACFTYGWKDLRGRVWPAEDVHALSLANLHGEYATVTSSAEILASVPDA